MFGNTRMVPRFSPITVLEELTNESIQQAGTTDTSYGRGLLDGFTSEGR